MNAVELFYPRYARLERRFLMGDYTDWTGWGERDDCVNRDVGLPQWDGKPVDRLHVVGEQGIGDEVLFSQLLIQAKERCSEIVFECDPRLVEIFNASLPVKAIPVSYVDGIRVKGEMDADAWCMVGDLCPMFLPDGFRRKPYLKKMDLTELGLLSGCVEFVTQSCSEAHLASATGLPTHVITDGMMWKWNARNLPGGSWWYPETTRVYDSWEQFEGVRWIQ